MAGSERTRATAIGGVAVLLWATLALLGTATAGLPPFQVVGLAFCVASVTGVLFVARRGRAGWAGLRQPVGALVLTTAGLFGFHFFYFVGLARAPAVEASLITYLWPLLIVVFASFLPGSRLRPAQAAGALLGLGGCILLVAGGGGIGFRSEYTTGYLAALTAAVVWAAYSVLNRRWSSVPTEAVAVACALTAVLAGLCHLFLEEWVRPTTSQALALVLLGVGPLGAAFFTWDHGTKHGDLPTLGALSYATPLASTLLLIATGRAVGSWRVAVACLLIVSGAILASRSLRPEAGSGGA